MARSADDEFAFHAGGAVAGDGAVVGIGAGLVAGVEPAGCGLAAVAAGLASSSESDDPAARAAPDMPAAATAKFDHVHGLAVNPADGALYAATHTGLFRLSGHGEATQVGTSLQDLMGFTVAGPDRFLASGHPDVAGVREGQPGQLGLIESDDGGGQWKSRSLGGEADLHAIAYADGRVYAFDAVSSRLLVTDDLLSWDTRALPAADVTVAGLAIDPSNRDRVVAATGAAVLFSADGGQNWRDLGGPPLMLIAWDAAAGLWGVAADGRTYQRDPATGRWTEREHLPGIPQAIHADGGIWYAAVESDDGDLAIYASSGDRWQRRYPS